MIAADRERRGSPERFGYAWAQYTAILPEGRVHLQRWLGSTTLESFAGKSVLDVGCGSGRNPYWYLDAGASTLLAIDYDDKSLGVARENLSAFEHATVERCSVYDLDPDIHGRFDRVTCIGVLHHLAEPEQALAAMWRCVAPGGSLLLWCYAREGNRLFLPAVNTLRSFGSRAPLPVAYRVAQGVAAATWPIVKVWPFQTDYYQFLRRLSFSTYVAIIFDQMLPRIAHYWTETDMKRLLSPLPESQVSLEFVQGNSWHARVDRASVA
jgi:SAM-dependent methyltransferase